MRRIISYLLCSIIICLTLPAMAAKADGDIASETQLLESLGILDAESADGGIVSRAELVSSVLRLNQYDVQAQIYRPVFTDLSEGHWAYSEMVSAYQLGYISADKYGKIYPDSPADGAFALRVLVNALSYQGIALSLGGSDSAYIKAADTIKLTDNVAIASGAPIERDAFVKLLYNALFVPLSESYMYEGKIEFNSSSEETLLSALYDVYCTEGVIEADRYRTLGLEKYKDDRNFIVSDGVKYIAAGLNTDELIGCYAEIHYKDENGRKTAVCVIPFGNGIVELKNCDLSYTRFKIEAFERNQVKGKKYNITANTDIILNNTLISENEFAKKIDSISGDMRLIDNNSDGKYDVIIAEEQSVVEIYGYSANTNKLTGADGSVYELDKYENVIYQSCDKTVSSPLILQNAKYISVFAYEGDYHTIVLRECKADIQAVVESTYDSAVELEIYGEQYLSDKALIKPSNLEPGQEYIFIFDCYGDIIDVVTLTSGNNIPVYLVDMNLKSDLSGGLDMRVINLQGDIADYACAEKISLRDPDGVKHSLSRDELKDTLSIRQPLLIRLNSEGAVNRVFQLASAERSDLFFHEIDYASGLPESEQGTLEYQRSRLSFSNAIVLRNNAVKMFAVPYAELENYSLDDFSIITQARFRSGKAYTMGGTSGFRATAICMDADDFICDYMVWEYPDSMNRIDSATLSYGLVKEVTRTVDAESELEGYTFKIEETEYWFEGKTDAYGVTVKKGDIVIYSVDYSGKPTNDSLAVLCSLSDGTIHRQGSLGNYTKNDRFRVAKATLIDKCGSYGRFRITRSPGTEIVQIFNLSGKNVQIYDKEKKTIREETAVSLLQKQDEVVLGIAVNALGSIYMTE